MGTTWTGGDTSARYERAKIVAQRKVMADQSPNPYKDEIQNATILKGVPADQQQPIPPPGKAEQQAAGSREQVLEDSRNGGIQILQEESYEEKDARATLRKNNRRRTGSSLTPADSLKGLRERVTGSIHGRTGGILGMEKSH